MAQAEYVALVRALAHQGLFRDELASLEPRLLGVGRARLQRCYSELLRFDESGTVVEVDVARHSFEQVLGYDRRPVPCHWRMADVRFPRSR